MNCLKRIKRSETIPEQTKQSDIDVAKKRIIRQASLTVLTLVLTVVILFAMTSAWYSNVVQTSGLTFQAESWGFDGKITLEEAAIMAAPGDEGIIDLTVENKSDSVSALSVNVSKAAMSDNKEMQKRLYFYVDTRMNREGETLDRVYVNRFEGYTYYVFNNSFLTLTKSYSNAPVLKWEWVYDVLGYYVIGKPDTVKDADGNDVKKMNIEEYLRPIQYDYDKATVVINKDEQGNVTTIELATVDGVQTPAGFLVELSKTDGYPEVIDKDKDYAFDNYYKVDVDENGYGVYAYLCNYSEIEEAIRYDTALGEKAYKLANDTALEAADKLALQKELQFPATISLSAQKDNDTAVTVETVSALQEALTEKTANVIQLSSDITLGAEDTIQIPKDMRVMLDLNGNTLTNLAGTAITAQPGSSLTLTGGSLVQADQGDGQNTSKNYGVRSVGAEVVMNKMEINDFQYGVYVGDNAEENTLDSRVYIRDSKIEGETCAAFISGNGLLTGQKSSLLIENSELYSPNIVVSGNGDATGNGRWGTEITIIDSKLYGRTAEESEDTAPRGVGIYQPQMKSTLTVQNSTVLGYNGIVLKGGTAKIHGSTIIAKGEYQQPQVEGSGFTNTGDAVYIETSYGYEIQLYISGNSSLEHAVNTKEEDRRSLRVFDETAENVLIKITSGLFQEQQPASYLEKDSTQTSEKIEGAECYKVESPTEVVVEETETTESAGDTNNETTEAQ